MSAAAEDDLGDAVPQIPGGDTLYVYDRSPYTPTATLRDARQRLLAALELPAGEVVPDYAAVHARDEEHTKEKQALARDKRSKAELESKLEKIRNRKSKK